jgi:eukaryotic-like serine/threonine-protein kinase
MTWVPGQKLYNNKYEIKQELGWGRFAITYLVQDSNGNNYVIKSLNPDLLNQLSPPKERDRLESGFADESRKLEKCKHPNIVCVIGTFMQGQLLCMVMEYIPGNNLANIVQARGFFPEKEALSYIQQIGQALIAVHQQKFLHRDVKPENIMIRAGTHEAVLIDFDLARGFDNPLTSRGNKVDGFTPIELYFNSPKQQMQRGAWTDVYSLAATLYVLLTGQQPVSAIDRKDQNQRLIPPQELNHQISDRTNNAIVHGMQLEPDKRPQTVEDWLKELGLRGDISLPKITKQQMMWVWGTIIAIIGVIATIAALLNDGTDLWDKLRPKPSPTPTNSKTVDTPSFYS